MTINEYQQLALTTANKSLTPVQKLENGVMGLCGEAGEVIDIVKKHLFHSHPLDADKLKDELGDVAWYLALTSHALGLTLEEVLEHNIEKLRKRYPEGFSAEKSLHREE
ncbi:MAG: nucleoside triphosphate pyrophosphohydrolase family protein [Clostridia bacterium]|nr:nucleoside triphosphate pyrophosphohydrolase family protein [Clostridia bacterium]